MSKKEYINRDNATTIPVRRETHERAKQQKRAGISWDRLVNRMVDQYDPDASETDTDE